MTIYPSITTTKNNWRQSLKDAKKLGVAELCLFPTVIELEERQEMFAKTKEAGIKSVPFVHLRSDMSADEINFLIDNFGTKVFNIHSKKEFPLLYNLSVFKDRIFVENTLMSLVEEIDDWAGLCFDVSHHENHRLNSLPLFDEVEKLLKTVPVGCCHLNAIKSEKNFDGVKEGYDSHSFSDLKEFDYCVKHKKYLPEIIALELENPLAEQLEAKKYLEKLLEI